MENMLDGPGFTLYGANGFIGWLNTRRMLVSLIWQISLIALWGQSPEMMLMETRGQSRGRGSLFFLIAQTVKTWANSFSCVINQRLQVDRSLHFSHQTYDLNCSLCHHNSLNIHDQQRSRWAANGRPSQEKHWLLVLMIHPEPRPPFAYCAQLLSHFLYVYTAHLKM